MLKYEPSTIVAENDVIQEEATREQFKSGNPMLEIRFQRNPERSGIC